MKWLSRSCLSYNHLVDEGRIWVCDPTVYFTPENDTKHDLSKPNCPACERIWRAKEEAYQDNKPNILYLDRKIFI